MTDDNATYRQWVGNSAEIRAGYTDDMSSPVRLPLAGYRVAVTSTRRAGELCAILRRYGADVSVASPIILEPSPDDRLRRQIEELIADPPDVVIVTTAFGFRSWIAAADRCGLADELIAVLAKVEVLCRGPKETGAVRAAGLVERRPTGPLSSVELRRQVRDLHCWSDRSGLDGRRVAVQEPGVLGGAATMPELAAELRGAGAELIPIRTYRWRLAPAGGEFDRLLTQIIGRRFDAVSFTSAPAVRAALQRADQRGVADRFVDALRSDVRAVCVGPTTALPLTRLGVPTSWPRRMRLAALARHVAAELTQRPSQVLRAAGHRIEIRRGCVLVDGVPKSLPPAQMAALCALAVRPGFVVARDDLLRQLPGRAGGMHAAETAVGRLRAALGHKEIIVTVVKRGYRLAIDRSPAAM